jgi:2-polyprenyl-6-methoxyphenol hydroxylase-like FAD-dependent oxidoreductase
MYELGILDAFLKEPHQKVGRIHAQMGETTLTIDLTHVPAHCRYIAFMPQWDFLNFLVRQAAKYPNFRLLMRTEVTGLIEEAGRVVGVHVTTPDGAAEVRADLIIGADGRHSVVREQAGLMSDALGAPMDVLWFRLPRAPGDPEEPQARFDAGGIFIMLNQGPHWQCGRVIPKGEFDRVRAAGLDAFKAHIAEIAPLVSGRLNELRDWDQIKLLTVVVDRLRRWWREGLLCIGDAAHAMSPIGGVGINLAIQDAVASANLLADALRERSVTPHDLQRVQARREWPTRVTQRVQITLQNRVISPILARGKNFSPPLGVRLMSRFPVLQRIPGWFFGVGVRPEHVSAPERSA